MRNGQEKEISKNGSTTETEKFNAEAPIQFLGKYFYFTGKSSTNGVYALSEITSARI